MCRQLLSEFQQGQPPFRSDIVIVFPSTTSRGAIVQATQRSRRGVRTFVVTDKGPPLDGNGIAKKQIQLRIFHRPQVFGAYTGKGSKQSAERLAQLRVALAPFLANLTLGTPNYKWLLFGHDDTVWMVENTLKLLRGLDHDQPYLITDNIWFDENDGSLSHPSPKAPSCLLCRKRGYSDIWMHRDGGKWRCILNRKEAPLGCPCNRSAVAANSLGKDLLDGDTFEFKNPKQGAAYQLHIGGGVIMSRGLFMTEQFDRVHSWMTTHGHNSSDGDTLFTSAIWDLMGIAPSKPGYDHCKPNSTVFDPGWREPWRRRDGDRGSDGGNDPLGVVDRLDSALQQDDSACDKLCVTRLDNMVSVHVRQPLAATDLSLQIPGVSDAPPRFNATATLIRTVTDRAEKFQKQRWMQEQAFMAAGNR